MLVRYIDSTLDLSLVGGNLELARCLFRDHYMSPTSCAYDCVLSIRATEEHVLQMLNWLHDEVGCKPEVDESLIFSLMKEGPVIQQWFRETLNIL